MQKADRHKLILDVIAERPITRQDELAELLRESGFSVTQASVSRDLDELGVVKVDGRYTHLELPVAEATPFGISAIEPAGENLIVIRCSSGLASAAAVRIDGAAIEEIVGTIAGDDTIFIAVANGYDQKKTVKRLKLMLATG